MTLHGGSRVVKNRHMVAARKGVYYIAMSDADLATFATCQEWELYRGINNRQGASFARR